MGITYNIVALLSIDDPRLRRVALQSGCEYRSKSPECCCDNDSIRNFSVRLNWCEAQNEDEDATSCKGERERDDYVARVVRLVGVRNALSWNSIKWAETTYLFYAFNGTLGEKLN